MFFRVFSRTIKRNFSFQGVTVKMAEEPVVTVQQGKLKGKTGTDYCGGKYFSFQGIPYAKPPLGELRFKVRTILFYSYTVLYSK